MSLEREFSECSEFSIFKPQILGTIDHIKYISHKRPGLDAIFDLIKKSTASNIDKEDIKAFIEQLLEQEIIVNKRSQSEKDSYRRITINDPKTFENQHIDSPDKKTECILQSDDLHNVPLDESTRCDFSIELLPLPFLKLHISPL